MAREASTGGRAGTVDLARPAEEMLDSLRELGYLPATLEAEVLDRVTIRCEGAAAADEVRRIVAEVFFERMVEPDALGLGLLEEEWKAVFG